jgi:ABC-type sugar transport system substrate-binding protein
LAISEDHNTAAAVARVEGLEWALSEYKSVSLEQVLIGLWRRDRAKEMTSKGLRRYPSVGAIWAANDPMALGGIAALQEHGITPGVMAKRGGLNWDADALEKVKTGELEVTLGGHLMTGGWLMVLLHEYHHGKDFAEGYGLEVKQKIFGALTQDNVNSFLKYFEDRNWSKIDFSQFSKVSGSGVEKYDCSPDAILGQQEALAEALGDKQ